MHSFFHKTLPIFFHNRWITNKEGQLERILWNADLLFIPQHNFATIKRMPMFNFDCIWNEEGAEKKLKPVYLLAKCEKIAFSDHFIITPLAPPPHPPAPHPPDPPTLCSIAFSSLWSSIVILLPRTRSWPPKEDMTLGHIRRPFLFHLSCISAPTHLQISRSP
jgi:hypothetical protein